MLTMAENIAVIRLHFIPRSGNTNELIAHAFTQGPHIVLEMTHANMPIENHISVPIQNLNFHPINELGNPIPQSNEQRRVFDVAMQVPNSETGDIDVYAFAMPD